MVFKSLINSCSSTAGNENKEPKASLGQLPDELLNFVQNLKPLILNEEGQILHNINIKRENSDYHHVCDKTISPFKILKLLEPFINENVVREIQKIYEFHLRIKQLEDFKFEIFYLDLKSLPNGQLGMGRCPIDKVDCIIKMNEEDLNDLLTDKLKPFTAYMSGRIEIEGDLQDVFKLKKIIASVSTAIKLEII